MLMLIYSKNDESFVLKRNMIKEQIISFPINALQYMINTKTSFTNNIIPNGIKNEITLIVFILLVYLNSILFC